MEIKAKKSLGQHFLKSVHFLEKIVSAAKLEPDKTVLEIGPGTGFLTEKLLQTGANVIVVEKDHRSVAFLQEKFHDEISLGKLKLIEGDILTWNVAEFLKNSSYVLVANIPYYITGAILEKFLEHTPRPDRMIVLVQKEVADRIVSRTKGKSGQKENLLSISVKAFGKPEIISNVPRGVFSPPPKVDSAILRISDITSESFAKIAETMECQENVAIERFFAVVKAGFLHKRKFLTKNLESTIGPKKLQDLWDRLGLKNTTRAEELSLEQWLAIAEIGSR